MKENYMLPLKSKSILFLVTFFLCLSSFAQETYIDRFNTVSYSNNNGSQNFSSSWVEEGDDGNANQGWMGNIYVSSGRLYFYRITSSHNIRRSVDLSAYPSTSEVTFTFDYIDNELEGNESLLVEIRPSGGSWKEIGEVKGSDNNGSFGPYTLLASEITANTQIRFKRGRAWGWNDYIAIDNVAFTVVTSNVDQCDPIASGNTDTDGDGIADICDLDDDNDGILDINELGVCTTNNSTLNWDNEYVEGGGSSTEGEDPVVTNPNLVINGTPIKLSRDGGGLSTQRYRVNDLYTTDPSYTLYQKAQNNGASKHVFEFGAPVYNLGFTMYDVDSGSSNSSFIDELELIITKADGTLHTLNSSEYTLNGQTISGNSFRGTIASDDSDVVINGIEAWVTKVEIIYKNLTTSPSSSQYQGTGLSSFSFCNSYRDTDNDGTPDYLDNDSDNDGCFDALEGNGVGLTTTNINENNGQLTGGVDSNGVPLVVGSTGQMNVSGTDASITGNQCDDDGDGIPNINDRCNGYDDNTDTDGDGVPDGCDLDNDNDGILDVDERPCFVFSESFGIGSGSQSSNHPNVPSNSVDNIMVGTNADAGNRTWFQSNSGADATGDTEGKYLALDNPNGASPVLIYQETITVLPNEEYSYSLFAAAAKEELGRPASNSPDVRMQIKDASGTVLKVINTGALSLSWQRFEFLFTPTAATVTFEIYNNNNSDAYNTLLLDEIFISLISCDSDGDGIPNYLDTDSDNDGCPDALEASENVTSSQLDGNGSINIASQGRVNGNGVPNLVNTSGAADDGGDQGQEPTGNEIIATQIQIDTQPSSSTICSGSNVTFTTVASSLSTTSYTGSAPSTTPDYSSSTATTTGLVYEWQEQIAGVGAWNDISNGGIYSNATTPSLTLTNPPVTASTNKYRLIVTSTLNTCQTLTSDEVSLTIIPTSVGGSIAGSTNVCTGTNSTTLTLSGQTGNIIRWESSTDNFTTDTDIANTTTTLTATNVTATTQYRAVVQSGACAEATSATATITVGGVVNLTIDNITADNIIDATEVGTTIPVIGTVVGDFNTGDTVTLVINGKIYTDTVDASGNYSINVLGSELVADPDTTVDGSFLSATSCSATASHTYTVDTEVKATIVLDENITADDIINAEEAGQDIAVTGTVGGDVKEGDTVILTVNGKTFTGTVDTDSKFSINVPGSDLVADSDLTIDASVTTIDVVRNEVTAFDTETYMVDIVVPTVPTVVSRTTNDTTPVITGTADSADMIEVTVNGVTYTEGDGYLVDNGNDTWSLSIPNINEIAEGVYDVLVEAKDVAGNISTDVTRDELVIDTTAPVLTITIDDITADNIINSVEAGSNILVTGTVAGDFKVGDIVTLTVNGNSYTGSIDSNGNFNISVPGVELVLDADKTVEANVSSTDGEGNRGSAQDTQKYFLQDTDNDGIPDVIDVDDDNDGIPDVDEGDGLVDTDGDGIPDSLDLDSDNDGINDVIEGGNGDLDTNEDGYIDAQDSGYSDTNGDGQADASVDNNEEPDTDGDGVPDYQDLDSDNDGINDVIEGGNEEFDTNGDGVINTEDTGGSDSDGDGISDSVDGDTTRFGEGNEGDEGTIDSDGDSIPDYQDLDSDNDGVNDVVEGGNPDTDGDGQVDNPHDDSDNDGIADSVDDLDGFGDADNPDYNSNPTDPNDGGNGVVNGDDSDGDGIPDPVDGLEGFGDAINDDSCVKVNNLMSPNGDAANSYLHIDCIENFQRNTIEIFNRWGNTVFRMEGYSNNNPNKRFEGVSNGRVNINVNDKLPVGTYFYILDLGNGSKVKKGWIYINR